MRIGRRPIIVALERIGRGILGAWCIMGPLLLIFGRGHAQGEILVVLLVLVLGSYAILVWQCRRHGLRVAGAIVLDTGLMILFTMIGGGIGGVLAALGGPALHRMGPVMLIFPLLGFWLIEANRRRSTPMRYPLPPLSP